MGRHKKDEDSGMLNAAISNAVKGKFDLEKFKESKFLNKGVKFKEQEWLPLSPAFNKAISLPGLALGHINIIRGHSDVGKSTVLIEAAKAVQESGKLPILIITEMKFSMDRAIKMGFKAEKTIDTNTGELEYKGNFIYVDKDQLTTIEDVAAFISDMLDEQKRGNIPIDIVFLVDSFGSVPCQQSLDSGKNNNMWNASAMATQFGNFLDQRIMMSRKSSSPYTNTLIAVNKIRVEYPMSGNPYEKPKLRNKAGDALYWDATLVITLGNITNSGVSKIKATKNKNEVEFAKRTKISVDKNHITDVTTTNKIITTPYGFIEDTKSDIDNYKKSHSNEWAEILGGSDFTIIEEAEMQEDVRDIPFEDND